MLKTWYVKPKQWWSHLYFFLFRCSSLCVVACLKYVLILLKCKHIIELNASSFCACVCVCVFVCVCPRKSTWICVFAFATLNILIRVCAMYCYLFNFVRLFSRSQRCVQRFFPAIVTHRSASIDEPLSLPSVLSLYSHSFSSNLCIYFLTVFISLRLLLVLIFELYFTHLHWYVKESCRKQRRIWNGVWKKHRNELNASEHTKRERERERDKVAEHKNGKIVVVNQWTNQDC